MIVLVAFLCTSFDSIKSDKKRLNASKYIYIFFLFLVSYNALPCIKKYSFEIKVKKSNK